MTGFCHPGEPGEAGAAQVLLMPRELCPFPIASLGQCHEAYSYKWVLETLGTEQKPCVTTGAITGA